MTGPSDTQYERAKSIFLDACELEGGERQQFVRDACGDDPAVRHAVERLFALDSEHGDDDDAPALIETGALGELLQAAGADLIDERHQSIPDRLGRYKIEGVLGEGGMGVVYRARQDEPDRDVALKVIRSNIPSHRLIRRFRHEAAVLGRLRHPGIAQVYEAGTADTPFGAQPYFAMELVDGVPLIDYAETNDLDRQARIRLFIQICEAVQHAHQRGVIHRDLKPGNILVDEHGQPKILDFGVARLVDPDMHTTTMHTEVGQLVGTFQYMSPEQARGNPSEVDTRSDVYALGMILYELLTGRVPYDLTSRSIPEAIRVIEHTAVSPLSTIDRGLRGDLETIADKALAKEKGERYQSAHELGADLQRFLNDEPILAHRPSTMYQLRKFAKRNKVLVTSVSGAFVFLIAVLIALTSLLFYALNQERAKSTLGGIIEQNIDDVNPINYRGRETSAEQLLDTQLKRVEREMTDYPVMAAKLQHKAGMTFRQLGLYERACELFENALNARRAALGERNEFTMDSLYELGHALYCLSRYDEALDALRKAYDYRLSKYGAQDRKTLEAEIDIGAVYMGTNQFAEAEDWLHRALDDCRKLLGENDRLTLTAANNFGNLLYRQGKFDEADAILRDTLNRRLRLLGPEHLETLESKQNLSQNCVELGHLGEAERMARETIEARRRLEGQLHPYTLVAMANLWDILRRQGKFDSEEKELRDSLIESRNLLIERNPTIGIRTINNIASIYYNRGKMQNDDDEVSRAIELMTEVCHACDKTYGPDQNDALGANFNLAIALMQVNRNDEAEVILRRGRKVNQRDDRDGRFYQSVYGIYLAKVLFERGAYDEAEPLLIAGYHGMVEWENANHPQALVARQLLSRLLEKTGRAGQLDALLNQN